MKTNEVKKTPIEIVDRTTILGGSDANRINAWRLAYTLA